MSAKSWEDKQVLVVGIGRSGYDVARVLRTLRAEVTACDAGAPPLAEPLEAMGVRVLRRWQGGLPAGSHELVVTSPGVPAESAILQEAVARGLEVWSEVEFAYHLSKAPIIGVTGTNGKSTTAALIAHILATAGYPAVLCGNIAAEGYERTLTAAASEAQPHHILVAEVSSFQLEWVHRFRPKVGVWTTLSADHLNRHRSMEEYGATKARLLRRQTDEHLAVVPGDDSVILSLVKTQAQKCYFSHQKLNITGRYIFASTEGVYRGESGNTELLASTERYRLLGEHNLRNLAAAVAACTPWSMAREKLEKAISTFQPLPHRMEPVAEVNGVTYVNNSMCTNLHALEESLRSVPVPAVVIAGGVDKSHSPFGQLVPLLHEKARAVVLIGADAERIERQLQDAGWDRIQRASTLEEAVTQARALAQPGDWVMLSPGCASFDMFSDFQERGRRFREVVSAMGGHS